MLHICPFIHPDGIPFPGGVDGVLNLGVVATSVLCHDDSICTGLLSSKGKHNDQCCKEQESVKCFRVELHQDYLSFTII